MIKESSWAVLRCFASAGRSHRLNCNFPSTESLLSVTLIFRSNVTRNRRRRFSNGSTPCWASPFRRVTTRTSCATESFCASSPTNWHRDASRRSRSAEQTSNWWRMFKGKNFHGPSGKFSHNFNVLDSKLPSRSTEFQKKKFSKLPICSSAATSRKSHFACTRWAASPRSTQSSLDRDSDRRWPRRTSALSLKSNCVLMKARIFSQ